ncbi:Rieske 2Fe-2S domain-containing protein [Undibacterium arcticum]
MLCRNRRSGTTAPCAFACLAQKNATARAGYLITNRRQEYGNHQEPLVCGRLGPGGRPTHAVAILFFGEKTLLYRKENGEVAMLLDRCPHKGAPLSLGELKGDVVACPYHGLEFDCSGKCVRIPSQSAIPPTAKVKAFPCLERYGIVWFWPGDPAAADAALLFHFEHYGAPEWEVLQGPYTHFPASIEKHPGQSGRSGPHHLCA